MRRFFACWLLALGPLTVAQAAISVTDDTRQTVTLPAPAHRIVSLAPHVTELLFAAGAGPYIVGVSEFSDYPPAAKRIPTIGSALSLDLERIIQLKPDLIVGWNKGNPAPQLAQLEQLGIPVYKSEPYSLEAIPRSIESLAHLAGTEVTGQAAASAFRTRLKQLRETYEHRRPVTVFYQIWRAPLMTLNGTHMVSSVLRHCGGENIFAELPQLAPTVSVEAVVKANPEAIIASSGEQEDLFALWRRFPAMKAVARGNLVTIDGALLNRSGPRILDGMENLCRKLDEVRSKQR
ncbi:MAG TPA: cobalamin-binding protein [Noviherbaspirillum sp.]|uniref:cobalamin-binding protein n=1 Tax=Noviherbaspirillum sp. TaxID=1926288 RepID=UPI002B480CD6|nr:cobalamin-binding protein [Noviherbaspirillum sp.]HJV85525.1 cobalamin-binding protein [Noviherbaspirillum sp.]